MSSAVVFPAAQACIGMFLCHLQLLYLRPTAGRKSCAITCATRLSQFLGDDRIRDKVGALQVTATCLSRNHAALLTCLSVECSSYSCGFVMFHFAPCCCSPGPGVQLRDCPQPHQPAHQRASHPGGHLQASAVCCACWVQWRMERCTAGCFRGWGGSQGLAAAAAVAANPSPTLLSPSHCLLRLCHAAVLPRSALQHRARRGPHLPAQVVWRCGPRQACNTCHCTVTSLRPTPT
jgi:hypothetical protein